MGAATAGLKPGDVVVQIRKTRTRTKNDLDVALAGASHGSLIDVEFVRDGALRSARVRVSTHADDRPEIDGPVIGIRYEPVATVPHVETRVARVEPDRAHGLMLGDVIQRVGERQSLRGVELARAVGKPDGAVPVLEVVRKGRLVKIGP